MWLLQCWWYLSCVSYDSRKLLRWSNNISAPWTEDIETGAKYSTPNKLKTHISQYLFSCRPGFRWTEEKTVRNYETSASSHQVHRAARLVTSDLSVNLLLKKLMSTTGDAVLSSPFATLLAGLSWPSLRLRGAFLCDTESSLLLIVGTPETQRHQTDCELTLTLAPRLRERVWRILTNPRTEQHLSNHRTLTE